MARSMKVEDSTMLSGLLPLSSFVLCLLRWAFGLWATLDGWPGRAFWRTWHLTETCRLRKCQPLGQGREWPVFLTQESTTVSPLGLGLEIYWPLTLTWSPGSPGPVPTFRQCQASIQQRCLLLFDYFSFLATLAEGYANKKINWICFTKNSI